MTPLFTSRDCLACHAVQGYTEDSIRGGIGISFDITPAMRFILFQKISMIVISIIGFAGLLILVYTFVMNLVGKIQAADSRIDLLSVTDELTGLYNRRMFFFRLEDEMNRVRRHGDSFSLLLIHIDHLRNLIDSRGPDAGDIVLKTVAEEIRSLCRKTDSVCRFAHDEMSVLLPSTGDTGAINIAEKICTHVGSLETRYDDFQILRVTVSIGVVVLDQKALDTYGDAKKIINAADLAVDRARNDGRNCVRVSPGTDL